MSGRCHYVQSALDARQTRRRTKVPDHVTSVAVLVNPGLDCSPIGDHTESREICRIDGSIQSVCLCVRTGIGDRISRKRLQIEIRLQWDTNRKLYIKNCKQFI